MSVYLEEDRFIAVCDSCDAKHYGPPGVKKYGWDSIYHQNALEHRLKQKGWKVVKMGTDVVFYRTKHYCPDCHAPEDQDQELSNTPEAAG